MLVNYSSGNITMQNQNNLSALASYSNRSASYC